jgi:anaerobic ribonucleoside-triphosphate reductase
MQDNNSVFCHDCEAELKVENEEIKGGKQLKYKDGEEEYMIFKCDKCFEKNPSLNKYKKCEVYSRVCGYLRPVQQYNVAKVEEYKNRKTFKNDIR